MRTIGADLTFRWSGADLDRMNTVQAATGDMEVKHAVDGTLGASSQKRYPNLRLINRFTLI